MNNNILKSISYLLFILCMVMGGNGNVILYHACFPMLMVLLAYDVAVMINKADSDGESSEGNSKYGVSLRYYIDFVKQVAAALIVCLFITYVLFLDNNIATVWGDKLVDQIVGVLSNAGGVAAFAGVKWYANSWWFIGYAAILIFVTPLVVLVMKKPGPSVILAVSAFLPYIILQETVSNKLICYIFSAAIGVTFAEYDVFGRIENYISGQEKGRILRRISVVFVAIVFSLLIGYLNNSVKISYVNEAIVGTLFILIAYLTVCKVPILNVVLDFIGKRWVSFLMITSFVYQYIYKSNWHEIKDIVYGRKRLAVFLFVAAFCVVLIIEFVKNFADYKIINKLYNSGKGTCILAIIPVIVSYVIAILTSEMGYMSVDDGYYQATMNGDLTGSPYPVALCINPILSYTISFMYKILPQIQWWYVYSHLILIVGLFLIFLGLLKYSQKKGYGLRKPMLLISLICVGFILYNIANIAFTIAPAILGSGIVCMMFYSGDYCDEKQQRKVIIASIVGFFLIIIHRSQTGYAYACYILMAYLYMLVNRKWDIKKIILHFVAGCVVIASIVGITNVTTNSIKSKVLGKEYWEKGGLPISYIDFTHDTYEENEEIYKQVGWTKDVYILIHEYCFMPDEVNTENIETILDNIEYRKMSKELFDSKFLSDRGNYAIMILWVVSIIILLMSLAGSRFNVCSLFALFNNMGTLLLILYQIFTGRILYRSVIILLLPAFLINIIISFKSNKIIESKSDIIKFVIAIMFVACLVPSIEYSFDINRKYKMSYYRAREQSAYEYVISNPENTYITTVFAIRSQSPWNYDGKNHPTNLIRWGDNGYNSNLYKEQLAKNGIDKMDCGVFEDEHVYFMINTNAGKDAKIKDNSAFGTFYRYLKENYDVVGFEQIDKVDKYLYVYKFVYDSEVDKNKSYLDITDEQVVKVECK